MFLDDSTCSWKTQPGTALPAGDIWVEDGLPICFRHARPRIDDMYSGRCFILLDLQDQLVIEPLGRRADTLIFQDLGGVDHQVQQ